jgi:16S rRNA (guanine(966)-N(2))-methyltransferase RsmD
MRERFFSIFGPRVVGADVLDLYAGTGAVGIEALSRGASRAVFVEIHRSAIKLIRTNLESLDIPPDRGKSLNRPAGKAILDLARSGRTFDLIWADPPFEVWQEGAEVIASAVTAGLAADGAAICLECPAEADVEKALGPNLAIVRDLKGGASRVVILRSR